MNKIDIDRTRARLNRINALSVAIDKSNRIMVRVHDTLHYVRTNKLEARGLYNLDQDVNAIEIADPPVVVRTPAGAKVMAWLPVEDEDRWA